MRASVGVVLMAGLLSAAALSTWPADAQKANTEMAQRVQKAREAVQAVSERLRNELGAAVRASGAADSIGLCQTISPDLATNASDEFGFEVGRTALRLRNPENAPDEWEQGVLTSFQSKLSAGTEPGKLEHYEVVTTTEGDKLFRYMKPIFMTELCMSCHGTDVKPEVKAELSRYYPEDKALGFKLGELRGAFSLAQLIEE